MAKFFLAHPASDAEGVLTNAQVVAAGSLPQSISGLPTNTYRVASLDYALGTYDIVQEAQNILKNGDFPTGLEGWTVSPGNGSAWDAATQRADVSGGGSITGIWRDFPTLPGGTYTVEGETLLNGSTDCRIRVMDGGSFANMQDTNVVTNGAGVQQLSGQFVATGSSMRLLLRATANAASTTRRAYFDNVKVYLTPGVDQPEPPAESLYAFAIGSSATAAYLGYPSMMSLITSAHNKVSLAVPGDTIAQQKAAWQAAVNKDKAAWVLIMVGLNSIAKLPTTADLIGELQDLVDEVRAYIPTAAPIVLMTQNPGRSRFYDLEGSTVGEQMYQQWLLYNDSIMGGGPAPIIGSNLLRTRTHTLALSDDAGNLKASFDHGDKIHYGAEPRQMVADIVSGRLVNAGFSV